MIVDLSKHWDEEHWDMRIDLEFICKSEGQTKRVFNKDGVGRNVPVLNLRDAKKILRYIVENATDSQLTDIQEYLDENSKTYSEAFMELRASREKKRKKGNK